MKPDVFPSSGRRVQTQHNFRLRAVTISWKVLSCAAGALILSQQNARAFSSEDFLAGPFHHEGITERAAYGPNRIVQQGSGSSNPSRKIPDGMLDRIMPNSPRGSTTGRQSIQKRRVLPGSGVPTKVGPLGGRPYEKAIPNSSGRTLPDTGPLVSGSRKTVPKLPDWNFEGALRNQTSLDPAQTDALNTLGWNADYIDSYLYSPLWWAQGLPSLTRFKSSLATSGELEKLHFDDLFTTEQVDYMWRRYTTGAMAGLIWAKQRGDVHAAQNIVGVSLHAMQDFYAHSNWIDNPRNRDRTYFESGSISALLNPSGALYTGSYELAPHLGIKPHGKFLFECTLFNRSGVKQLMSAGCSAISPLTGGPMCQAYDACQRGISVGQRVKGIKVPGDLLFLSPPGIALDNHWVAGEAASQRGLGRENGDMLFETASTLAERQSRQWVQTLAQKMTGLGTDYKDFWTRVRTEGANRKQRTSQFEDFSKLPYQFLSAGPYPPSPTKKEEIYLRVQLFTANDSKSGTDGDILFSSTSHSNVLLDYNSGRNPALNYDDFEAGDNDVYAVGPFDNVPPVIQLRNDAANTGDVFVALGRTFVEGIKTVVGGFVSVAEAIIGTKPDFIRTNQRVFSPADLANVPTAQQAPQTTKTIKVLGISVPVVTPAGQKFQIDLNGGDEGHYVVTGYITKTGESPEPGPKGWREFEVMLHYFNCIKESKFDRTGSHDEPFILALLAPLPGTTQRYRSSLTTLVKGKQEPISVDTGERVYLNHTFQRVNIPKDVGYLNVPISAWEHDDETQATRNEMLNRFAGDVDQKVISARQGVVSALGSSMSSAWKLRRIEVTAWSRNGKVRVGTVLAQNVNRWIKGGDVVSFDLNPAGMRTYNISAASLVKAPNNQLGPRYLGPSSPIQPTTGIQRDDHLGKPMLFAAPEWIEPQYSLFFSPLNSNETQSNGACGI